MPKHELRHGELVPNKEETELAPSSVRSVFASLAKKPGSQLSLTA